MALLLLLLDILLWLAIAALVIYVLRWFLLDIVNAPPKIVQIICLIIGIIAVIVVARMLLGGFSGMRIFSNGDLGWLPSIGLVA